MIVIGIDLYNQTTTEGVAKTLSSRATDADHVPCVLIKTLTEKSFFEWHEDDVSVTLRNKGGSYGGERSACGMHGKARTRKDDARCG